jgi:hypothetical protein
MPTGKRLVRDLRHMSGAGCNIRTILRANGAGTVNPLVRA